MGKLLIIFMLVVFANCSEEHNVLVTKKVYSNISKNAILDATKTLFNISNESNGDKSFIIDSYRDKIEVSKVIFRYKLFKTEITLDKWILELYQMENETRANLIFVRRDGVDENDVKSIDVDVHQLFWDKLDYLLGIKKQWNECNSYFTGNIIYDFCRDYFIDEIPENKYVLNDISISNENIKLNTIDSLKSNILDNKEFKLANNSNLNYNQSENIEDVNMLNPIKTDEVFKVEAPKQIIEKKSDNQENEKVGIEDLKDGELLDVNKQMNKFKKDLENIINTKPQNEDTDSKKIISKSSDLKENSEFDLKSKQIK
jgi:hypothetical protein